MITAGALRRCARPGARLGAFPILLTLAWLLAACPPASPPPVPPAEPDPQVQPGGVPEAAEPAERDREQATPAPGGDEGVEAPGDSRDDGGEDGALLADGASCFAGDECESGICEGQGCGADEPGQCMSRGRACTRDLRPFCGCDGQTFEASGTCPGQRYARPGRC